MTIFLNAIYRFNEIPIKFPNQFFIQQESTIFKFIWNNKKPRIAKTVLHNKRSSEGITIPYLKALLLSNGDKNCMVFIQRQAGRSME